ncbi:glycosyltransferase [Pseudodesulfovibrio sp.]|uniref:glycosyltransferase n=1 Tax=Pseudodesulfovibrio sp. TaxID=2035812 RepID=UPI0026082EFE|nr:glycosyltransferase [Pseudodesulfovibrio sp.]MDD3313628.1 glycosyltransferase [Pseudodesulfovibrio sp.]
MRVLSTGSFLAEGFRALGHEVVPLAADGDTSLQTQVDASGCAPDLVLLELFGNSPIPREISRVRQPTVAHVIDSPLNEFWLFPLLKSFDHVFVDQRSSAEKLRAIGIGAHWLPLFAFEPDFRDALPERHFLTFVGRITEHRKKRFNLLKLIANYCEIHQAEGLGRSRTQTLFAESRVVLNENFFSGVNLRTFQAMSAGSVLLAERGDGMDELFTDGEHYVAYEPGNLPERIDFLERNPEEAARIAANGQAECRARHTARHRAGFVLERAVGKSVRPGGSGAGDFLFSEAQARYLHALRFGGNYGYAVAQLGRIPATDPLFGRACLVLGRIRAMNGDVDRAREYLRAAVDMGGPDGATALALLLLIHLHADDFCQVERLFGELRDMAAHLRPDLPLSVDFGEDRRIVRPRLFLALSRLMHALGNTFQLGFEKPRDPYPATDFELATLAWEAAPTGEVLDMLIRCLERAGIGPEALPFIRQAILTGQASDQNILKAIDFAQAYYDVDLVKSLAVSLAERLRRKRRA